MNKRIKQLADEAAKYSAIMFLPTGESGDELFVKKFAELIVRECIETMYNTEQITVAQFVDATLKQHFGVDE